MTPENRFRVLRVLRSSNRLSFQARLGILLALLFFGALFWAKGRDPFQRIWFKVKTPEFGKAECIALLANTAARPLPVVIYLHGSGGSLLGSGNDLRQMAEMGLAAVGMEYSQTNEAAFAAQFAALQSWLGRQKWADTNQVAWVGYSLGAQRQLRYLLQHQESQPPLLVRLAGGWVAELGAVSQRTEVRGQRSEGGSQKAEARRPTSGSLLPTALLLHGEQDMVFSLAEAQRVAAALQSNGFPVELRIISGQSHSLDPNRGVLFRAIGEYCLKFFHGERAFENYDSILAWQQRAQPLWLFWLPALAWVIAWWYSRRAPHPSLSPSDGERVAARPGEGKLARWEIALRWLAGILATLAIAQTALHLIPPQLAVGARTLDIARKHLIQPKEKRDFELLASNPVWQGKRLKALLTHVELANYNRELINWKLDDEVYRQFVLSPQIDPAFDGDLHWRRWLWESFYPRIRKQNDTESAAEIIGRHLCERVTIIAGGHPPRSIVDIWIQQRADAAGFEAIYVAALRSAGVPARLSVNGQAEFHTGAGWKLGPRPVISQW